VLKEHIKKGAVMKGVPVVRKFATPAFLLAFLFVLPVARADEWNQAMKFTFSQPVQIPGRVLPAGTYIFELVSNINHELVRVSSPDRNTVFALIQAIPTYQRSLSGKSAIILAKQGESQPEAVVAWSYAGQVESHQLLYPKQVRSELAKDKQDTIVFGD
jgi:hypothetical protein